MKTDTAKAKKHLKRIRELVAHSSSPLTGMSKEEIIRKLRKDREEIWEEKFAARS